MKALVTGGCGFIGSNIIKKLKEDNVEVIVLDTILNYDIQDYEKTKSLYNGIDFVFHTAAEISIPKSLENPPKTFNSNINGTNTVLKCSLEAGVRRIIFSSTSAVYGNSNGVNVETQREQCLNPYSISKLAGENLCSMYTKIYGLETIILRYFNVYGEGQSDSSQYSPVIARFLKQRSKGESLTITGSGTQKRDFVHVKDVAEANIKASLVDSKYAGETFNIGTGVGTSIVDIAKKISKHIIYLPKRDGESEVSISDNSKAKSMLNWSPQIDLNTWIGEQG